MESPCLIRVSFDSHKQQTSRPEHLKVEAKGKKKKKKRPIHILSNWISCSDASQAALEIVL